VSDFLARFRPPYGVLADGFRRRWRSQPVERRDPDRQIGNYCRFESGIDAHEPAGAAFAPLELRLDPLLELAIGSAALTSVSICPMRQMFSAVARMRLYISLARSLQCRDPRKASGKFDVFFGAFHRVGDPRPGLE
jgi:hypothetical protein